MQNENPLISVIVPVYNVEAWLSRCVDSVLSQSASDCELILVDDGSTDRSGTLCDMLVMRDARVRVLHMDNNGQGEARNQGLLAACGSYVQFLDADDELVPGCLARIKPLLREQAPEVLVATYEVYEDESGKCLQQRDCMFNFAAINGQSTDSVVDEMRRVDASPSPCRYVLQRQFLLENRLFFEKGLHSEDALWTPQVLCTAIHFWLYEGNLFRYNIRSQSTMTTVNFAWTRDACTIVKKNNDFARGKSWPKQAYLNHLNKLNLATLLKKYPFFCRDEKQELSRWFRKNRAVVYAAVREDWFLRLSVPFLGGKAALLIQARLIRLRQRLSPAKGGNHAGY